MCKNEAPPSIENTQFLGFCLFFQAVLSLTGFFFHAASFDCLRLFANTYLGRPKYDWMLSLMKRATRLFTRASRCKRGIFSVNRENCLYNLLIYFLFDADSKYILVHAQNVIFIYRKRHRLLPALRSSCFHVDGVRSNFGSSCNGTTLIANRTNIAFVCLALRRCS